MPCPELMTVTPALETCMANRRNGPGRVAAPHRTLGQRRARAGEEENETNHVPWRQTTHPSQAASTVYFTLDDDEEMLAAWVRPAPLSEVAGPQDWVLRHVVEQIVDFAPVVQILDLPVPPMVDAEVASMFSQCSKLFRFPNLLLCRVSGKLRFT